MVIETDPPGREVSSAVSLPVKNQGMLSGVF